ncbi:hypothetical protein ACVWWD_003850 [Mesorhizobium sp. URHB0026]
MRSYNTNNQKHVSSYTGELVVVLALICATLAPAHADLVGSMTSPPALTDAERETVAANPVLAHMEERHPWLLRMALNEVADAAADRLSLKDASTAPAVPRSADDYEMRIIQSNPGLESIWRSSPEAAVDLLALIRAAGGKKGPRNN